MEEQNREIVQQFYDEIINKGNLELAPKIIDQDFIDHDATGLMISGLDNFIEFFKKIAMALPDLSVTVEDVISEDDKVVARVMVAGTHKKILLDSIPATGKHVRFGGIDIFRLKNGKIVERWNQRDMLSLMQQLGVVKQQ